VSQRPPRRGRPPAAGKASDTRGADAARDARDTGNARDTGEHLPAGTVPAPEAAACQSIRLPPSGLAREILAAVEQQERQAAATAATPSPTAPADHPPSSTPPDPPPDTPPGASLPPDPNRIFSFAESLERRAAQAPAAPPERPESWVTFELAGERYALPVTRVQEITRAHGITRVPHAPPPVRGIANLRGRVLVVVDLRLRLGLPPVAADARSRILVVSARERSLGLLVDAAHQVIGLLPSRIEPPPPDLMDERSAYLAGVVQLDDSLVIALDVDQVLLVPEDSETPSQPEAGGPP
jgi:purine-binding chemotaxis protein CheW